MIETGRYKAKAVVADGSIIHWTETKEGHPQFIVVMSITEKCPFTGQRLMYSGYFTPLKQGAKKSGADMAWAALRALGFQGDDLSTIGTHDLVEEVEIVVIHEERDVVDRETGETHRKTFPRIQWLNPVGGGQSPTAFIGDRKLDPSRMKAWAAQQKASAPKPTGPVRERPAPSMNPGGGHSGPPPEDDIPF